MTLRRMGFACWISKATNKHSDYVILIAFPLQNWLHERASMLRYTYTAHLVFSKLFVYKALVIPYDKYSHFLCLAVSISRNLDTAQGPGTDIEM
jgi:hypothetical protein